MGPRVSVRVCCAGQFRSGGHTKHLLSENTDMANTSEDLHVSQLARGAALALANAESLFREAAILLSCRAYSRCLFLHQISLEECGKIEILGGWATSLLMGLPSDATKVESALANHKAKNFANAYMLPVNEAERAAREASDWSTAMRIFDEQQANFHNKSNERKNAALYVDLVGGVFHEPAERITEEMCHQIAGTNAEFLQLVRPKVAMLARWSEDLEGTRATLMEFQARLEALRAEHPSDPQRALDGVLDEMLGKMKGEQAMTRASPGHCA
jgi:AbiV family abortive infection protein